MFLVLALGFSFSVPSFASSESKEDEAGVVCERTILANALKRKYGYTSRDEKVFESMLALLIQAHPEHAKFFQQRDFRVAFRGVLQQSERLRHFLHDYFFGPAEREERLALVQELASLVYEDPPELSYPGRNFLGVVMMLLGAGGMVSAMALEMPEVAKLLQALLSTGTAGGGAYVLHKVPKHIPRVVRHPDESEVQSRLAEILRPRIEEYQREAVARISENQFETFFSSERRYSDVARIIRNLGFSNRQYIALIDRAYERLGPMQPSEFVEVFGAAPVFANEEFFREREETMMRVLDVSFHEIEGNQNKSFVLFEMSKLVSTAHSFEELLSFSEILPFQQRVELLSTPVLQSITLPLDYDGFTTPEISDEEKEKMRMLRTEHATKLAWASLKNRRWAGLSPETQDRFIERLGGILEPDLVERLRMGIVSQASIVAAGASDQIFSDELLRSLSYSGKRGSLKFIYDGIDDQQMNVISFTNLVEGKGFEALLHLVRSIRELEEPEVWKKDSLWFLGILSDIPSTWEELDALTELFPSYLDDPEVEEVIVAKRQKLHSELGPRRTANVPDDYPVQWR